MSYNQTRPASLRQRLQHWLMAFVALVILAVLILVGLLAHVAYQYLSQYRMQLGIALVAVVALALLVGLYCLFLFAQRQFLKNQTLHVEASARRHAIREQYRVETSINEVNAQTHLTQTQIELEKTRMSHEEQRARIEAAFLFMEMARERGLPFEAFNMRIDAPQPTLALSAPKPLPKGEDGYIEEEDPNAVTTYGDDEIEVVRGPITVHVEEDTSEDVEYLPDAVDLHTLDFRPVRDKYIVGVDAQGNVLQSLKLGHIFFHANDQNERINLFRLLAAQIAPQSGQCFLVSPEYHSTRTLANGVMLDNRPITFYLTDQRADQTQDEIEARLCALLNELQTRRQQRDANFDAARIYLLIEDWSTLIHVHADASACVQELLVRGFDYGFRLVVPMFSDLAKRVEAKTIIMQEKKSVFTVSYGSQQRRVQIPWVTNLALYQWFPRFVASNASDDGNLVADDPQKVSPDSPRSGNAGNDIGNFPTQRLTPNTDEFAAHKRLPGTRENRPTPPPGGIPKPIKMTIPASIPETIGNVRERRERPEETSGTSGTLSPTSGNEKVYELTEGEKQQVRVICSEMQRKDGRILRGQVLKRMLPPKSNRYYDAAMRVVDEVEQRSMKVSE